MTNKLRLAVLIVMLAAPAAKADEPKFTVDRAMNSSLKKQIAGDLVFLRSIRGSGATKLHQEVFGDGAINGEAYLQFLGDRLSGFRVDMHPKSKMAVAYNRQGYNKLFITPNYINNDIPQVMRVSVFLHEARHSEKENGYWSHDNCPDPYLRSDGDVVRSIMTKKDLSGEAACDSTPLGAYGIQAIALKNIETYCVNCTAKVKMDAGLYGDDDIDTRIIDADAKLALTDDLRK